MGRVRSARALQLLMPLAGERFSGVNACVRRRQNWSGFFEPNERGRRDGAHGSRKARGGVQERTFGCGSRAVRLRRATESPPVQCGPQRRCDQIDHGQSLLGLSLSC